MSQSKNLLVLLRVSEPVPRMEYGKVIDKLHIPPLEPRRHAVLLPEEVQRVQGLRLGFCYGRAVDAAGEGAEAHEVTAGVLEEDTFGDGGCGGLVEEEGAGCGFSAWVVEPLGVQIGISSLFCSWRHVCLGVGVWGFGGRN